jgi:hypothetical protein
MKFLATANSLDELAAQAAPDLRWQESDGEQIFLWVDRTGTPEEWSFTLDDAHSIRQSGRTFWAFLDSDAANGRAFDSPEEQFMLQKFCRDRASASTRLHDGNQTTVQLLARRDDGAAVFKIVYCSTGGERAEQEQTRTFVIYIPPGGKPILAARDLGSEGGWNMGWIGYGVGNDATVVWHEHGHATPFHIKLRQSESVYARLEGNDAPNPYDLYRDGLLQGPFPFRPTWEKTQYALGDGKQSLNDFAHLLAPYWCDFLSGAAWASDADRRDAIEMLREKLHDANPSRPIDQAIEVGAHVIVPDETATTNAIVKAIQGRHPLVVR